MSCARPNNFARLGLRLRHQVLPIELLQGGALEPLTASNSLLLTLGSF